MSSGVPNRLIHVLPFVLLSVLLETYSVAQVSACPTCIYSYSCFARVCRCLVFLFPSACRCETEAARDCHRQSLCTYLLR